MRVLHYIGITTWSGVDTFVLQLCAAQKRAGLLPAIVLDGDGREAHAAGRGIPIHTFPVRQGSELRLPRKLGASLLRLRRVRQLVHLLRKSDILHVHEGINAVDAFVAAQIAGIKAIIVTHHGSLTFHRTYWRPIHKFSFWLEKRWASRVVLPYRDLVDEFIDAGIHKSRTCVVPFCVDEQLFTGIAAEPRPGALKLAIAARLVGGKGHTALLSAVAQLRPRHPGLQLLIIGDGPMRSELEAEVERLGLSRAVEFQGHVDHSEMPGQLRRCHIIALPSHMLGETFPVCLLEGMALGLPAIGTRWFGIPDIVADNETGILVEPQDVNALTTAIERFLTDPALYARARQNALARFREHYASTAVAASYSSLYQAAMRQ